MTTRKAISVGGLVAAAVLLCVCGVSIVIANPLLDVGACGTTPKTVGWPPGPVAGNGLLVGAVAGNVCGCGKRPAVRAAGEADPGTGVPVPGTAEPMPGGTTGVRPGADGVTIVGP